MNHRVTRVDHAVGAALCVLYVAVLLYTAPDLGLSRDESMYVAAAESYAEWFTLLIEQPLHALQQAQIDRYFTVNHEHPGLVKSLFALSYLLDRKVGLFTRESLPFRFVGMLCAGLLLWLIHVLGTRLHGRRVGLFAAIAFALLPRPFYHSHLDAFDIPITLAVTAVAYAYLRSLQEPRWAWMCGALFGLALATKHNSWLLPGIFAMHHLAIAGLARLRGRFAVRARPPRPYWLLAMATLGPLLFIASWPWLWHHTAGRIRHYAAFHLHHEYYNIAYFGVNYFWPPFPISYPWVMTLYTVPIATLLLAVLGITLLSKSEIAAIRACCRRSEGSERAEDDPNHTTILLLGLLLAPLVIISLPSTPIFGGTKHWFTAYPFLMLFAGVGFDRFRGLAGDWLASHVASAHGWITGGLMAWMLAPALVETIHSHPFGLSHYGFAAGFVPGAADRGMNRQFWGFTTGSLVDFFDAQLPNGGSVFVCDTTELAFDMLARDGLISERIVPSRDIAQADFAMVHHEHHFAEVDYQIWTVYGTTRPVYVLTYDGVPIISVYRNPMRAPHGLAP